MGSIKRPKRTRNSSKNSALADFIPRHKEFADEMSVSSRQRVRHKMQVDIDAFLASGGTIQHLDIAMSAEKLRQR